MDLRDIETQHTIISVAIILCIISILYYGSSTDTETLSGIKTEYKVYYTAEFSEYEYDMISDGYAWDYWSEPASEVYQYNTYNGELIDNESYYKFGIMGGLKCEPPTLIHQQFENDPDFDNFKLRNKLIFYGFLDNDENTVINEKVYYEFRKHGFNDMEVKTTRLYGSLVSISIIE